MTQPILGFDIAKAKFDLALFIEGKFKTKVFENRPAGFEQLREWLKERGVDSGHACMEATGPFSEELATFLHDAGFIVSIVNPAQVKGFAQSQLSRNKTDKADAKLIARFCQAIQPPAWQPPPLHIRHLQAWVRRLEALQDLHQQEINRLEVSLPEIRPSIRKMLANLDAEIEAVRKTIKDHIDQHPDLKDKAALMRTIPGVGEATVIQILAKVGDISRFQCAKQLAAFIGLNPRQHSSGSSVQGRTHLSKTGESRLRKALYLPAVVAKNRNPVVGAFCDRLLAAGKPKMVVVCAAMRKLVHIIFGVLKSGRPFDAKLANAI